MANEWVVRGNVAGYINENGRFIVCEEYGTDEQFDKYSTEVQNGDGYYDDDGHFVRTNRE